MIHNRIIKEITPEQKKEIKETFEILDADKENKLKMEDLKIALSALGFNVNNEETNRIKKTFQIKHGDKTYMTYPEFLEIVTLKLNDKYSQKDFKKIFEIATNGRKNKINHIVFKELADRFNENISDEQLDQIIKAADFDKDGVVGEKDFIKVLNRTHLF